MSHLCHPKQNEISAKI